MQTPPFLDIQKIRPPCLNQKKTIILCAHENEL